MNLLGLKNFKITNLISEKVDNELLDIIFNIIKYYLNGIYVYFF